MRVGTGRYLHARLLSDLFRILIIFFNEIDPRGGLDTVFYVRIFFKKVYNTALVDRTAVSQEKHMHKDSIPPYQKPQLAVWIHAAMMASLPVYLLLVLGVLPRIQGLSTAGSNKDFILLRTIFYGAAISIVLLIRRIQAWYAPKPEVSKGERSARKFQVSILSSSLCEVPAVLGLTLVLLAGWRRDFYFLLLLSLALFVIYFPRRSFWSAEGRA